MREITAETFLGEIWPKNLMTHETLELRVINRKTNAIRREFLISIDDFLASAKSYGNGWDVYFGVSTRFQSGGKKKDCYRTRCVWIDLDKKQTADFETIKPTFLVKSGSGLHAYWLLNEPVMVKNGRWVEIEAVNRALCQKFEGDIGAIDVSRILRVPGFFNYKYDPPRRVKACIP